MRHLIRSVFIFILIFISAGTVYPAGLSSAAKETIIKKTPPASREFIRQYLDFSDYYSSKECLEYASKTNQDKETLVYCNVFFNEDHGLTRSASNHLRDKAGEMKFSPQFRGVLSTYLMSSRKYEVKSCIQYFEESMRNMSKGDQLSTQNICKYFFQN